MPLHPLLVLVAVLLLAACGADRNEPAEPGQAGGEEDTVTSSAGVEVTGAMGSQPRIEVPDEDPPGELVVHDLVEGDGETAATGAIVTTHYVGVSWSNGEQFDASWDRGQPVSFPLDRVIAGWSEGIPGMNVGGRRLLVIPPDLAYGDQPPPGSGIAPGETLVFVIDLLETQ